MLTNYDHVPSDVLIEQYYEALQDAALGLWRARVALKSPAFPSTLSDGVQRVLTGIREVIEDELRALNLTGAKHELHFAIDVMDEMGESKFIGKVLTSSGQLLAMTPPRRRMEDIESIRSILNIPPRV